MFQLFACPPLSMGKNLLNEIGEAGAVESSCELVKI